MNNDQLLMILTLTLGIIAVGCNHEAVKESVEANDAAVSDATAATMQKVNAELEINEALASLSPDERKLAEEQRFCPVHVYRRLGSTGTPIKVETTGKPIFVCSQECVDDAKQGGAAIKRMASGLSKSTKRLSELTAEDRASAERQKYCPVMSNRLLGTMGKPIRLEFEGQPVFICCPDCLADAEADPKEMLARVDQLTKHQTPSPYRHGHAHGENHEHGGHKHSQPEHGDHSEPEHGDRGHGEH